MSLPNENPVCVVVFACDPAYPQQMNGADPKSLRLLGQPREAYLTKASSSSRTILEATICVISL